VRLGHEIAAIHAPQAHPAALVGEFRRTAVLVPLDAQGGLHSAELGGVRWLYAFSDEASLARFALTQGDSDGEYAAVLGARLLDVALPAIDGPAGVAVDVGSPQPLFFLAEALR
jgi:hypothetical protein